MKNKGLILLLFLTLTGRLVADNTAELSSLALKNMMTAQVSDFQKNGNVPVSLHTGALNLSIPLYTIKDLDFNLPISLGYNSEGFKPRKHSGYVGLNWFLNVGGCITREVRGYVADDCIGVEDQEVSQDGFLIYARNQLPPLSKDSVFNFSRYVGTRTSNGGFVLFDDPDYMPDIFHFNFCGYSGAFTIGNDGKPLIMNGDFVEVDLTQVHGATNIFFPIPSPEEDSEISIKTLDGYTYKFGGDLSALEYSIHVFCNQSNGNQMDNRNMAQKRPAISSWHLKKIIAPNGRLLELHYKPFNSFMDRRKDNLWVFNEYYEMNITTEFPILTTYMARSATKEAILDSITISDGKLSVVFQNSVSEKSLYYGKGDFCNPNYQLDSLQVIANGELLKTYRLNYEYKADNFETDNDQRGRRFLNQVVMNDRGIYSMKYNHPLTYTHLDIPTANEYQKIDYFGYTKDRFDTGLISEIKYPTGGKSTFRYEPHKYSLKNFFAYKYSPVDQTSSTSGNDGKETTLDTLPRSQLLVKSVAPSLGGANIGSLSYMRYITDSVNNGSDVGGARIASIANYNEQEELVEQKNYLYQREGDSKSSGVYYDKRVRFGSILLSAGINSYDLIESPIGYSTVVEEQILYPSQSKWYTTYNFSGKYVADNDIASNCRLSNLDVTDAVIMEMCSKGFLSYSSSLGKNGYLLSKTIRENSPTGPMTKLQIYKRHGVNSNSTGHGGETELRPNFGGRIEETPHVVILANTFYCSLVRKIYPVNGLLEWEKTVDYIPSGSEISQMTWYDYDSCQRIAKKLNESSDKKFVFEYYRYADDVLKDVDLSMTHEGESPLLTSNIAGYFSLNKNRMIGSPVETISGYFQNGQEYVTGGTLHLYGTSGQNILLSKPVLSRSLSLSLSVPLEDFDSVRIENNRLVYSSLYVPTADYTFNSKLRLTSIQPYGLLKTSYIWDPNNLYPTSQTTGDQTVTYNYKPFVGMQSQTDARGITTYYSYDAFGRLVEVYQLNGGKKEILNAYSYNYAH